MVSLNLYETLDHGTKRGNIYTAERGNIYTVERGKICTVERGKICTVERGKICTVSVTYNTKPQNKCETDLFFKTFIINFTHGKVYNQ